MGGRASGLLLPSCLPSTGRRGSGWWVLKAPRSPPLRGPLGGFQMQACALGTPIRGPPNPPPLCPHPAFYAAISLAGLLTLGAVLGAAATVREAGGLMAGVSSPCPQCPSLWDGIRSRQDGESPGSPPPPTVSSQKQRPKGCAPARTSVHRGQPGPLCQAPLYPLIHGGPERQRRPSQAWGPLAKAQGGSGSAAPEALGTGFSFLLLSQGCGESPSTGQVTCRACAVPALLLCSCGKALPRPTRDSGPLLPPFLLVPLSPSSFPWACPTAWPARPAPPPRPICPAHSGHRPSSPTRTWAHWCPGLPHLHPRHPLAPALPAWGLLGLLTARDRVPLMEAGWAQGPRGGPTGPTRRVLDFM